MIRGTTPTHMFSIPFDVSDIDVLMIIYAQNNIEVFRKNKEDCVLDKNTIKVTLTQEETLRLSHLRPVQIQVRILTMGGQAFASDVHVVSVQRCLNDEVL